MGTTKDKQGGKILKEIAATKVIEIDIDESWNDHPANMPPRSCIEHTRHVYNLHNAHHFVANGRPHRVTSLNNLERLISTQDAEIAASLCWHTTPEAKCMKTSEIEACPTNDLNFTTGVNVRQPLEHMSWQMLAKRSTRQLSDEANVAAASVLQWASRQRGGTDYDRVMNFVVHVTETLQKASVAVIAMLPNGMMYSEPTWEEWETWLSLEWKRFRTRARKAQAKEPADNSRSIGLCGSLDDDTDGEYAVPQGYITPEMAMSKGRDAYHFHQKERPDIRLVENPGKRNFVRIAKRNGSNSAGTVVLPPDDFGRDFIAGQLEEIAAKLLKLDAKRKSKILPIFISLAAGASWGEIAAEQNIKPDACRRRFWRAIEEVVPEYVLMKAALKFEVCA